MQARPGDAVDGHDVPVPYFGAALDRDDFAALRARFEASSILRISGPCIRFDAQPGERATMSVRDPGGNTFEFMAFLDRGRPFAKHQSIFGSIWYIARVGEVVDALVRREGIKGCCDWRRLFQKGRIPCAISRRIWQI